MTQRAESIRVMRPLFHAGEGGSIPTSALQLLVDLIDFPHAVALNGLWHSRLPLMKVGFIKNMPFDCFVAEYDGLAYAVAIWSNPVAAALPQYEWLELRRFAIAPDAPKNTASRMLAVMARLIRRKRPEVARLISYQDEETHAGTIYRAAGWQPTLRSTGGSWDRPNARNQNGSPRTRPDLNKATGPKQRWEKVIRGDTSC